MKFQRNTGVLATEQDDELILLNPETGKYFGANGSGAIIWSYLEHPLSIDEIVVEIVRAYSGDESAIRETVANFVGALVERGLAKELP